MPGIVGIIGAGRPAENEEYCRRMVANLIHDPSYQSGVVCSDRLNAWIGWANHGRSFSDCMPLWNEKRDICMVFSGEDYSDTDRMAELIKKGHRFEAGNAGYLVHLYEDLGADFFNQLNGLFCGVILDFRQQKAILFNDRYGLGRIYIHEKNGCVFFSSEAKSLLGILPELRELDHRSLAETVSLGCVIQNRTLFPGISLVPGGSVWTFRPDHHVNKESYFSPTELENLGTLTVPQFYKTLRDVWARILPRYFKGPERMAVSLTGGKDSRMILAWAPSPPGSLPCYTFGGPYRDCFDVKIARQVASACQQPFQVLRIDESFFRDFCVYAEKTVFITDGTMDVSGAPGIFINRLAKGIAPIRLTGNYGQEILRASIAFKPQSLWKEIFEESFAGLVGNVAQRYYDEISGNRLSFVAFKQVPWHHYANFAAEYSQISLRSPFLDHEILRLAYQAPDDPDLSEALQLQLISEGKALLGDIETDRGLLNRPIPLYTWIKRQAQEFTFKAEYAYDYGMPRILAKFDRLTQSMHLERLFLGRHKFAHFRIWYRDRLSEYVKEILLDPRARQRPYLKGDILEIVVNDHIRGRANYTREIHRLLTLEIIQRTLLGH